ncbi:Hypothetical predicted protein [Podarcis lilfordi]|uniref:Uncharacterized protein n=1 Tax=Podarcis lilfordi TaxID=74358 RepID=A0AA35K3F1_9SAUR|nr:Hypothetical predicted protein [Podarcis lilfordi]
MATAVLENRLFTLGAVGSYFWPPPGKKQLKRGPGYCQGPGRPEFMTEKKMNCRQIFNCYGLDDRQGAPQCRKKRRQSQG